MNAYIIHDDTHIKHLQTIYLKSKKVKIKKIIELTGYTKHTINTYCRKYVYLLEEANKVFFVDCEINYNLDEIDFPEKGAEQIYLMKFYDLLGQLIFSKIGTTTRTALQRAREESKYYEKHGIEVGTIEIESVIDCKDLEAEAVESYLRWAYIKQYPHTWKKNDRFFGVNIDVNDFKEKVAFSIQ